MKKLLLCTLLLLCITTAALADARVMGDLDGDGVVSLDDVWHLLRQATGRETASAAYGDIDGSGKVDMRDALMALQGVTGSIALPPAGSETLSMELRLTGQAAKTVANGDKLTLEALPLLAGTVTAKLGTSATGMTWTSSNTAVAAVAADGTITCKGFGTATLTGRSGSATWQAQVTFSDEYTYQDNTGYRITYHATANKTKGYDLSADKITFTSNVTTVRVVNPFSNTTVTAVGADFMAGNTFVTTIYLPDTIADMGPRAFKGCTAMKIIDKLK